MSAKRAILASLIVVAVSACGPDEPPSEGPRRATNDDSKIYDRAGWATEKDPVTGREFRCITAWYQRGYPVGFAMFCYEPDVER